mgnify:CR=1 FL=1
MRGDAGKPLLRSLEVRTWVQVHPAFLPALRKGKNRMRYVTGDHHGLPTRVVEIRPDAGIAAGSLFLGADTILGPIYLGIGFAEGDRHNLYFCRGQLLNDRRPGRRER